MATHYHSTKLAATDTCYVKTQGEDGPVVSRGKIVEVKEEGVLAIAMADAPAQAPKKGRKKAQAQDAQEAVTIDVDHASTAAEDAPCWYAFCEDEKLDTSEDGIVGIKHTEFNYTPGLHS